VELLTDFWSQMTVTDDTVCVLPKSAVRQ